MLFPTQIIVAGEMEWRSHVWLKALSGKMKKQDMKELLEKTESIKQKFDRELADSVLEVSIRANQCIVDELGGDDSMCQALLEIMEPEINKIVEEATEKVRKETEKRQAINIAKAMISSGNFSPKEIVEYVPGVSIEEVMKLKKS